MPSKTAAPPIESKSGLRPALAQHFIPIYGLWLLIIHRAEI